DVDTVTVVETTGSPQSKARARAFAQGKPFPVKIRGLQDGQPIDEVRMVTGVADGLSAREDMDRLRDAFSNALYVLSNTGDRGFEIPDSPCVTNEGWSTYPELLTVLLFDRFRRTAEPLVM